MVNTIEAFNALVESKGNFMFDSPFDFYLSINAASSSALKQCVRSPRHGRHYMDNPKASSDAMLIGTAFHLAMENMDKFKTDVIELPALNLKTKAGREERTQFKEANNGKIILPNGDLQIVRNMVDNCLSTQTVQSLIHGAEHEVSGYCKGQFGVPCKFRADLITETWAVVDFKTTRDASEVAFAWDCRKFMYHLQAAFYLDCMARVKGFNISEFIFVAVENVAPYGVGVYRLDYPSIRRGRKLFQTGLMNYIEATSDYQTCYPDKIGTITI